MANELEDLLDSLSDSLMVSGMAIELALMSDRSMAKGSVHSWPYSIVLPSRSHSFRPHFSYKNTYRSMHNNHSRRCQDQEINDLQPPQASLMSIDNAKHTPPQLKPIQATTRTRSLLQTPRNLASQYWALV
jgi:hypothetical protein